jgi:hypothetical protein
MTAVQKMSSSWSKIAGARAPLRKRLNGKKFPQFSRECHKTTAGGSPAGNRAGWHQLCVFLRPWIKGKS